MGAPSQYLSFLELSRLFDPCSEHEFLSRVTGKLIEILHMLPELNFMRFLKVEFYSKIPNFIHEGFNEKFHQTCHEGSWCTFRGPRNCHVMTLDCPRRILAYNMLHSHHCLSQNGK